MADQISKELRELDAMTVSQLRDRHFQLCEAWPHSYHRQHLVRDLAWKIQATAFGGVPEDVRQYALAIARNSPIRVSITANRQRRDVGESLPNTTTCSIRPDHDARIPMPGSLITKDHRGTTHVVRVLQEGFEYAAKRFGSLSAIAREITGTKWNGYTFFGLR